MKKLYLLAGSAVTAAITTIAGLIEWAILVSMTDPVTFTDGQFTPAGPQTLSWKLGTTAVLLFFYFAFLLGTWLITITEILDLEDEDS